MIGILLIIFTLTASSYCPPPMKWNKYQKCVMPGNNLNDEVRKWKANT